MHECSIIIVNWNTKDHLKKCLDSIYKETKDLSFEIIVIDNGSKDKSSEMVKKDFPEVKLVENKKNMGFARANNQGIKIAQGDFILLLNPDTIILDNAIKKTVDFLKKKPVISQKNHELAEFRNIKDWSIGICGCRILNPDFSLQPSCRKFPNLLVEIIILLKLHHLLIRTKPIREYFMLDFKYDQIKIVDQVMGAFFMVKKRVFEKIGLLDEKYFIWYEEVDFCKRAKKAGFLTCFFPNAEIIHQKGAAFTQVLGLKNQIRHNKSLLRYFRKHKSIFSFVLLTFFSSISLILAGLIEFVNLFFPQIKKIKKKEL